LPAGDRSRPNRGGEIIGLGDGALAAGGEVANPGVGFARGPAFTPGLDSVVVGPVGAAGGKAARAGNGLLGLLSTVRMGNIGTAKMRVDSSSTSVSTGGEAGG